ncbi:hypothetical protein ACS3YM_02700 [Nocardia sp. N13]|uniref:hypothetical protein n=1 Tax=Nocardioides sp. N13(2025) TaxID=3453405 RepID=UPI003F77440D
MTTTLAGPRSSLTRALINLPKRLFVASWGLFSDAVARLWRFTFRRWWNFLMTVPAFAALIGAFGAITLADVGVWISVFALLGVRAGIVAMIQTVAKSSRR